MKLGLNIFGILLTLVGVIWFFQGIGVIGGSFMTDESMWAIIGAICVVIGGGLLFYNNRVKTPR
ncbi:MAG: hypothetical protein H7X77_05705 [Anaerolineae bacterium]|nr:hypothetical protein [Anaerolineae bacterium]